METAYELPSDDVLRQRVVTSVGDAVIAPASTAGASGENDWDQPDGGLEAWKCLLGSFCLMFPSFGFQTAIGSVQDYLLTHQLSDYTVRDVGWITASVTFLTLFLGVQVGPLFDRYGPRHLLLGGTIAGCLSFFLLAECTKYWHFLLCLGVCGGLSAASITTVAISVLSHWFHRRRALASGICMGGSSFGGIAIPLILNRLYGSLGWAWSMRTLGFISAGFYLAGVLFVKGRLPRDKSARSVIDFKVFRSPRMAFLSLGVFSFEFIIFGCGALLPTYARFSGFSDRTGVYSLAVLNGLSFFGRTLSGVIADRFGRFNILLTLIILTQVVMAGVWLPLGASSEAALYAVVALFGFGSGSWLSLAPVCAGQLCRTEEYGRFYGTMYAVAAFGVLLTVPIGGELLQATSPQVLVGFYSGVLLLGLVGISASRWAILDWKWAWKVKV